MVILIRIVSVATMIGRKLLTLLAILYAIQTLAYRQSTSVSAWDDFPWSLMPVEETSRSGKPRSADAKKQTKILEPLPDDIKMKDFRSIAIDRRYVGEQYTISAIAPGDEPDHLFLLRRRQDSSKGLSEFKNGIYDRIDEGPIRVDCVLKLNVTTEKVSASYIKNVFYYPNAMVKDPQGAIWFSDAARHQVLMYKDLNSRPQVTIGKELTPGGGKTSMCAPNDIAVSSQYIYVADGCDNKRVVMFNKNGQYVSEFSSLNPLSRLSLFQCNEALPKTGSFLQGPKAIAVDEPSDRLYVADEKHPCFNSSQVLLVNAGNKDVRKLGETIRFFQHDQLQPNTERLALHPRSSDVFMINSDSIAYLRRGFTFNTHTSRFVGAWGPDQRGFVRPRAISVSRDGATVYVSDAAEEKPETIWIFQRDIKRARRNTKLQNLLFTKGSNELQPLKQYSRQIVSKAAHYGQHRMLDFMYSLLQSKGVARPQNKRFRL